MDSSWNDLLSSEFQKPYMQDLKRFLEGELQGTKAIYPPRQKFFQALHETPLEKVKVVLLGQDPYHGPGQAEGLCFSVQKGVAKPPSLQNIFKELASDIGCSIPEHGSLMDWAKQGVLLLNATLSVREGEPKSHFGRGWEIFTDRIVHFLYEGEDPKVFILWGKSAMMKMQNVRESASHLLLTAPHPSPLSAYAGFFGCRHFSKANAFLEKHGKKPIDWEIR